MSFVYNFMFVSKIFSLSSNLYVFRAWVPLNQVFMLSKEPPIPLKQKKAGYQQSLDELKIHIAKLKSGSIVALCCSTVIYC
jgi:hypothetical protein